LSQLFAPSLQEQIACIEREIALRRRVYPRWIEQGRLKPDKAEREIECMCAVLKTLKEASRG
jgi:hypothetical protein